MKNCHLKMQKKSISGFFDGLPKPPEAIFSPHQNHLEAKIGKAPPTTSLNNMEARENLTGLFRDWREKMMIVTKNIER